MICPDSETDVHINMQICILYQSPQIKFYYKHRLEIWITIYSCILELVLATIEFLQGMDRDLANAALGLDL